MSRGCLGPGAVPAGERGAGSAAAALGRRFGEGALQVRPVGFARPRARHRVGGRRLPGARAAGEGAAQPRGRARVTAARASPPPGRRLRGPAPPHRRISSPGLACPPAVEAPASLPRALRGGGVRGAPLVPGPGRPAARGACPFRGEQGDCCSSGLPWLRYSLHKAERLLSSPMAGKVFPRFATAVAAALDFLVEGRLRALI